MKVCLLNDSFPPKIDGVANAVKNYAAIINEKYGDVIVATPNYPGIKDDYPYEVVRYMSVDTSKLLGYRAGYPFSGKAISAIEKFKPDIIHSHCPIVSTYLARELRDITHAPIVFTYHTKFDIDMQRALRMKLLQHQAVKAMVNNINACDEVWAVSGGAAENLHSLGYEGDIRIMDNGVDIVPGRSSDERVNITALKYGIDRSCPVFLFVGRIMWYKGLRIIIDGLSEYYRAGNGFTMIFVGDGINRDEVMEYAKDAGIGRRCIFTGAVYDREVLRDFYTMADLFLFLSTYDTNGLVVREAAACSLASVLVEGSCAAESITDSEDGFLCSENAESLCKTLIRIGSNRELLRHAGENACKNLYFSWEQSIDCAVKRYGEIINSYTYTPRSIQSGDELVVSMAGEIYKQLENVKNYSREFISSTDDALDEKSGKRYEIKPSVPNPINDVIDLFKR